MIGCAPLRNGFETRTERAGEPKTGPGLCAAQAQTFEALFLIPDKNLFQRFAEYSGDTESDLQRRRIFALFDRGDCLAGDADFVSQISLRHFSIEKAQCLDLVVEG